MTTTNPGATAPSLPVTKTQIVGWATGAARQVHKLSGPPEVENLRRVINDYSRGRVERSDGWWVEATVPVKRIVQEHNVRRGRALVVERLVKQLPKGAWVLDWAGGTGWTASMLLAKRPDLQLVSLDISDVLQEWGQENYKAPIVFVSGDATNRSIFEAETFDAMVGTECVEHFPNLDQAIATARYWLRPGGQLVVTTPNPHHWAPEPPDFVMALAGKSRQPADHEGEEIYDQAIRAAVLAESMRKAGFATVRTEFTQFGGEWPLQAVCKTIGYSMASLVAHIAEAAEVVSPEFAARKLGFTQIVWATR
jgi:ubiquinone/menaquinone biosynthesis C-methylase UbiE